MSAVGKDALPAIGGQLRDARQAAGLSLRALGARAGLSVSALRRLEAGAGNPSLFTVAAASEALGLTLDALLGAARDHAARASVIRSPAQPSRPGDAIDLTGPLYRPQMRGRIHEIAPASILPAEALGEAGPFFCFVVSGRVRAAVDSAGGTAELRAGDALHAISLPAGGWANPGGEPARLVCLSAEPAPAGADHAGPGGGAP